MIPPARYPNFEGKHRHDAIFSPAEVMASQAVNRPVVGPEAVILTYQPFLLDELQARGMQPAAGYSAPWLAFTSSEARNAVVAGGFGIETPAAAVALEELVALGAREVISVGAAGCLQPRCGFGRRWCHGRDPRRGGAASLRPAETFAWPSETLTSRLTQALAAGRDR